MCMYSYCPHFTDVEMEAQEGSHLLKSHRALKSHDNSCVPALLSPAVLTCVAGHQAAKDERTFYTLEQIPQGTAGGRVRGGK